MKKKKDRPIIVQKYNDYKGGLDIADNNANRYFPQNKQKRWTKKSILYLLKGCLSNSWIIYKLIIKIPKLELWVFMQLIEEIEIIYNKNKNKSVKSL